MARLLPIEGDDLADATRAVFAVLERERGYVPNLYRVAAHAPHFLPAFVDMVATARAESALPSRLKELAVLEVARLTASETMWASHLPIARAAGLSAATIDCLPAWQSVVDTAEERAVLALVDEATQHIRVSAGAWAAAAVHFDSEQLAELVFVVAFYNMVARILEPLAVERDPRYENAP